MNFQVDMEEGTVVMGVTEVTEDMVGLADMEATPIMAAASAVVYTVMGNSFYSFFLPRKFKIYDFYYFILQASPPSYRLLRQKIVMNCCEMNL